MIKNAVIPILIFTCLSVNAQEVIDRIVAKVGREIILNSELEMRIQQMEAAGFLQEELSRFDILREMMESRIIVQKAKERGYEIDDLEVKDLAQKQIDQISAQFPDEDEFRQQLKKETGLTILELKEFYIEMIIETKLRDQFINEEIRNKVHVTEAEVENYYLDNKADIPPRPAMDQLGTIMMNIEPSNKTKEAGLIEINSIMDRLKEGEDFNSIIESLDPDNKDLIGGDLGFFGKGMMVKPFEEAAFALREGEISNVVETRFGYHILKMVEKKEDEVRVKHILRGVAPTENDIQAVIDTMEEILARLRAGEDFYQLAREFSQDETTAENGGIIGEFASNEYPELFREYFTQLDYGEYSELVQDGDQVFILGKLRQIPERPYTYEEISDRLRQLVISEKENELYENLIADLTKEIYIETFLEE